jgi:1-acyl-sn-glycerol-3-phosphate acyltransferase
VHTPVLDLFRPAVRVLARVYFGLELRGIDHIPAEGAVLIVPNHQTYADPPLVTIPIRRPVYYMAWSRLFEIPGLSLLIRRLRAFPVDVDSADRRASLSAARLLQAGHAVMIFPEGGRGTAGRLGAFKPGAFRLAVSVGVPVLPVTIAGGHQSWPPGRPFPRPGRITISYHPLIHPERGAGTRDAVRWLSERTRAAIASALPADVPGPAATPDQRMASP